MNTAFGLDIGATAIKAVWLRQTNNGFLLNSSIIAHSPQRGILSEASLDIEEMARAIKKAVDQAKITTKNVNIALPEGRVYTKVIDMPVLPDKELAFAIQWEAEQYIPVPLSDITLAFSVIKMPKRENNTNEKMQVLIVGAPSAIVKRYQKILTMAGFNIVAIETEMLSITRALFYTSKSAFEVHLPPTVIINMGASSTSLGIVKNGALVFIYSMPIGGTAINRAIETDFGLSETQAEEYKRTYGILKEGVTAKIATAIEPILNNILSEVKKALVFYAQKYTDEPIRQILLCGGAAKIPGIDLFFANNLSIETAIANPWRILVQKVELPKELSANASDYTIAIGLAMRVYE